MKNIDDLYNFLTLIAPKDYTIVKRTRYIYIYTNTTQGATVDCVIRKEGNNLTLSTSISYVELFFSWLKEIFTMEPVSYPYILSSLLAKYEIKLKKEYKEF